MVCRSRPRLIALFALSLNGCSKREPPPIAEPLASAAPVSASARPTSSAASLASAAPPPRFTVTKECGLPDEVKQEYFKAGEDDIEVNQISPTGYPMRMIKASPGIGDGIRPNCEAYGYLLDANGKCAYIEAWNREVAAHPDAKRVSVMDKTCLCTHMRNFAIWTCGQTAWRLKDTSVQRADGSYQLLSAEHVFRDYQFSTGAKIALPETEAAAGG